MRNTLALFCASLFCVTAFAQTLPVGTPVVEDAWRRSQLKGQRDIDVSFTVRPFSAVNVDSLLSDEGIAPSLPKTVFSFGGHRGQLNVLSAVLKQQYSSYHPYGWNDGAMIPAKGYQTQLSAGVFAKLGGFSLQVQPEFVYAQNAAFTPLLSGKTEEIVKAYYETYLNKIDAPERFGTGSYAKIFPGQSSLRYNYKKFSLGLSTENMWWGPGVRNALVMTNNAPGFLHFTLNTTAPVRSPVGTFEGQVISGWLKKSGYFPDTMRTYGGEKLYLTKPTSDRYLNGMVFTWQPRWTKGLYLGLTRVYYVYQSDLQHTLNGYLPTIGLLFKGTGTKEDRLKRDEMLSVFFRLLLPNDRAEVYGEFGRNDHSANLRDFLLEPEHSRAYLFGLKKLFPTNRKNTDVELMAEFTSLQFPSTIMVREQQSWYAHYQVLDGYTNKGQVVGAGIGPGSNSQTFGLHWVQGLNSQGAQLERVVHNNDFYYTAFAPSFDHWSHWVDISLNLNKSWHYKQFLYEAKLDLIRSMNYQWRRDKDVYSLRAAFNVAYRF